MRPRSPVPGTRTFDRSSAASASSRDIAPTSSSPPSSSVTTRVTASWARRSRRPASVVGGASSPEHAFQRHGGREWGYVVSGHLHVTIGFDDYELGPGDAISIPSTVPHRLVNHGKEPVHAIWFVIGRNSSQAGSTAGQPLEGERSAHQQPPRRAAAE